MDVAETGFADMRQGFRMNILIRGGLFLQPIRYRNEKPLAMLR